MSLTVKNFGLSAKEIIIPSFETTTRIFQEHLIVMASLRERIELLKQAYFAQMDRKKTWEQVDQILSTLEQGCKFLNFPEDLQVRSHFVKVEEPKEEERRLSAMPSMHNGSFSYGNANEET